MDRSPNGCAVRSCGTFNREQLRRIMRTYTDENSHHLVADKAFQDQVFELIEWASSRQRLPVLVRCLHKQHDQRAVNWPDDLENLSLLRCYSRMRSPSRNSRRSVALGLAIAISSPFRPMRDAVKQQVLMVAGEYRLPVQRGA